MQQGWTISGGASGLCGDYIGATAYNLADKSTHLILWNWKTGERKVDAVSCYPQRAITLTDARPPKSPCRRPSWASGRRSPSSTPTIL